MERRRLDRREADHDEVLAGQIDDHLAEKVDITIPWDRISEETPGLIDNEGIHLTEAGRTRWIQLIVDAVDSCPTA